MKSIPANCPEWLSQKILKKGGQISFYEFMKISLNDLNDGYYGSGKSEIGLEGDFVTSPSLSNDFAYLLAGQIEDWIKQIRIETSSKEKVEILEFGAGNGELLKAILEWFLVNNKDLINYIRFKIVEINPGMIEKQKKLLSQFLDGFIDISWISMDDLASNCVCGIVIAHEVLDAFPVERIQYSNKELFQQIVSINHDKSISLERIPLPKVIERKIDNLTLDLGINIPPMDAPENWTSEIHMDNTDWLGSIYGSFKNVILLVIDYSLDAKRFYSSTRKEGTLLAYKDQVASGDPLFMPGECDLTSHVCNEVLINDAKKVGFESVGMVKQGEALLRLGLAERLHEIQNEFKYDLSQALIKREALLRLVDPICLGDFKWFVFQKFQKMNFDLQTKFLID